MTSVQIIANTGDLCGECPLWAASSQSLYWTDIAGRKVFHLAWPSGRHSMVLEDFEISGLALHAGGGFIAVNSSGLWRWDGGRGMHCILDEVEGQKCALNDCIADPGGRLFSGSCFFDPHGDYPLGYLFRFDPDGSAHIVDEGIHLANGLGFSSDCSTLYFTDSAQRIIYAYDYRQTDGQICNRRPFLRIPGDQGIPDGLTVDAEGFVWSAQWFGGCIVRYDPDGTEVQRIAVPAAQTSSLAFAGPDLTDIFITSASMSDALSLAPPCYAPAGGNIGGQLFHLNLGIQGKLDYAVRLPGST
jgi:sugar lactone lactonase YvrE